MAHTAPGTAPAPGDILAFGEGHRSFSWKKLGIILLLVLPILAAMVYMWSMYDPSKSLREVDLAVVNEDAGVDMAGEQNNFGESVVEGLLGRDYLSFAEVSPEEAKEGLASGKYLFTVRIPEDFSKNVATLMDKEPKSPEIEINLNDFNGTNGSVLTGALVPQIKTSVSSSISESYAEKLVSGVNQLGSGLNEAAKGAGQLDAGADQIDGGLEQALDGTTTLDEGAGTLHNGAVQLRDGTVELKDGTGRLTDGTARLVDGTGQLSEGAATLVDGTYQLGDGAAQINAGVGKLTDKAVPPLQQAQGYVPQIKTALPAMRAMGLHDQANKLESLLAQLDASNPENLVTQLNALKEGTATLEYMLSDPESQYLGGVLRLQDGINQADAGARELNSGALQLADGATRLNDGATQLSDGSGQLKAGTTQLLDGQRQLKDGSTQLSDGTEELSTKLAEGAGQAPTIQNEEASAKQVAVPIKYVEKNSNPVQLVVDASDPTVKTLSGGASMLMILVFGFLLMAVAAMSIPHVFGTNRRTAFVGPTLKSFAGLVAVGLVILAALAVGSTLVGWNPASKAGIAAAFLGMAGAAAATNQMLRALLGRVTGAVAMLAFFALGLFSFGGVWPLATVPKIFQWLHPLTPMTYGRDAFVAATQGLATGGSGTFVTALTALAIFTLVPLGITLLVRAGRVRRVRREFESASTAEGSGGSGTESSTKEPATA